MPLETTLVQRARELARLAHANHKRKAANVPYFTHLESVAQILMDHGYTDEIQLAAAYLHDLIEDRPAFAERMRDEMPPEVVATVEAITETKADAQGKRLLKSERFARYVAGLREDSPATRRATPISCADKIHNTQSLIDAEKAGLGLLLRLSTRPGQHEAQLAKLRVVYAPRVSAALLASFDKTASKLVEMIDAWLPGRSIMLAAEAHLGQFDEGGKPYVQHPMRLALAAETRDEQIVAALHDVVEGSRWTLEALAREGFSPRVVRAVDHLTRREKETYDAFLDRVATNRLATKVKLLDLRDNSNLDRISGPTDKDRARVEKYQRATVRLESELEKRTLQVRLDEASHDALAKEASLPILRADHITLAFRIQPSALEPSWIPGGVGLGDTVALTAVAEHGDARVQAFRVEVDESSVRPFDGGMLHVTVSRAIDARSRDANSVLETGARRALQLALSGTVEWT